MLNKLKHTGTGSSVPFYYSKSKYLNFTHSSVPFYYSLITILYPPFFIWMIILLPSLLVGGKLLSSYNVRYNTFDYAFVAFDIEKSGLCYAMSSMINFSSRTLIFAWFITTSTDYLVYSWYQRLSYTVQSLILMESSLSGYIHEILGWLQTTLVPHRLLDLD